MAERTTLNQVIQIGVETTPGTAVAATKRMAAMSIEPSPNVEVDQFRPAGQKYRTLTSMGKEWVQASVTGKGTYTEMVYPLSSIVAPAVITTPSGGVDARNWQFISSPFADDNGKTFTVEHGDGTYHGEFANGVFTEFGLSWSRSSVDISGSMMGTAFVLTGSQTGGLDQVDLVPVLPTQTTVYLDATDATFGAAVTLDRVISAEWSLGNRYAPVWPINAALGTGYAAVVESEPDLSVNLTLDAQDAATKASGIEGGLDILVDYLRQSEKFWLRIESVGALIDTNGVNGATADVPYTLTVDTCVEAVDTGGFSDTDGLQTMDFSFVGITDTDWGSGQAFEINAISTLTAL